MHALTRGWKIVLLITLLFSAAGDAIAAAAPATTSTSTAGTTGTTGTGTTGTTGTGTTKPTTPSPVTSPQDSSIVSPSVPPSNLTPQKLGTPPISHYTQSNGYNPIGTMENIASFVGSTSANTANQCTTSTNCPDPCFVSVTANPNTGLTTGVPTCPAGWAILFMTGTRVFSSVDGKALTYTDAAPGTAPATLDQYNFYTGQGSYSKNLGFNCPLNNNASFSVATSFSVKSTTTATPQTRDASQPVPPTTYFTSLLPLSPNYPLSTTATPATFFSYSNQLVQATSSAIVNVQCYLAGGGSASYCSCVGGCTDSLGTNWGRAAGAYLQGSVQYTLTPITCTRSAGFWPIVTSTDNPNGYPMPTNTTMPFSSPTVAICGKLIWQPTPK